MGSGDASQLAAIEFGGVAPVFRVRSVTASLDYYVRVLGFQVDWQAEMFASVSRGRCTIFVSEGDQGNPGAWAWVGVNDVDAVLREVSAKGARVRHPPTNYQWAREMQLEDPDGNVLRVGSDPNPGEPIGEWLDMYGQRWMLAENGAWQRIP